MAKPHPAAHWNASESKRHYGRHCLFLNLKLVIYSPPEVQLELRYIFSHATYWCLVYLPTVFYRKPHIHGAFMNSVQTHFWMDSSGKAQGSVQKTGGPYSGTLKEDLLLLLTASVMDQDTPPRWQEATRRDSGQKMLLSSNADFVWEGKENKPNVPKHTPRDGMRANLCSLLSRTLLLLQSHSQHSHDCPRCYWHYEHFLSCALQKYKKSCLINLNYFFFYYFIKQEK